MLDFFALTDPILQMQMSNTMKTGSTVGRMLMGACARLQVRKRRRRPLRPFHQHHRGAAFRTSYVTDMGLYEQRQNSKFRMDHHDGLRPDRGAQGCCSGRATEQESFSIRGAVGKLDGR